MILIVGGAFQGKKEYAYEICENQEQVVFDAQDMILSWMKEGKDVYQEAEAFVKRHADGVITLQEMGSGIIPMDEFEREYRELCGRIGCIWAKAATQVYRVVMGVSVRIK
ncbi:MAG: bifunctional adenosylcobinamide kinase/adenosylcobinamide-phosphate guanylyltransferase [Eubacterium sp.]|nr:bifunctional adenosylcobinamide kinase/adenosylcobinamide-phosphate guanylyltransferase [Eubacterium sp.]